MDDVSDTSVDSVCYNLCTLELVQNPLGTILVTPGLVSVGAFPVARKTFRANQRSGFSIVAV